jgi:hypothetical protein
MRSLREIYAAIPPPRNAQLKNQIDAGDKFFTEFVTGMYETDEARVDVQKYYELALTKAGGTSIGSSGGWAPYETTRFCKDALISELSIENGSAQYRANVKFVFSVSWTNGRTPCRVSTAQLPRDTRQADRCRCQRVKHQRAPRIRDAH